MPHYKAILIDWDDTIGDFHQAEVRALKEIFEQYSLQRAYPDFQTYYNIYSPHNLHLWDLYGESRITKEELEFECFYHPIRGMEHAESIALQIAKDFLRLTTQYFTLIPDAGEVIRALALQYPLTVVSNGFVEVQYEKIRRSGLADCFQHVVLSEQVGAQKPNPLIFERALALNNLRKDDCLMIGDSWNSDIQGARNAGIDQLWITATPPDEARPATYRVGSIREVPSFLSTLAHD